MRFVTINGIYLKYLLAVIVLFVSTSLLAHDPVEIEQLHYPERKIEFPDIKGYKTLVVDLHTHSSFSDGHVWPKIRIEEALRDGLDAIAITEHIEWQPHRHDIPHNDRNRAYQIANEALPEGESLLVIAGSEITRRAPHGHMNAVFIKDANALLRFDESFIGDNQTPEEYLDHVSQWPAEEAIAEANQQGAFVFWNHPFWTKHEPSGIAQLGEFQTNQIELGNIHGIEIANGKTFSEEAFQIALDKNLTVLGVSDVHDLVDWDYDISQGGHRPVTLVFTKKKNQSALKKALMEGRTVVWFKNILAGREEHINALLKSSIRLTHAIYQEDTDVLKIQFKNTSDASFILRNLNESTFARNSDTLTIPAHSTVEFLYKPGSRVRNLELNFEVLNTYVRPREHAKISYSLKPTGGN